MSLLSRIEEEFLTAYKAKEMEKVAVLRMLKTAAKNKQIELGRELEDDDVLDLLAKALKQRQESVEQFRKAGREDLAAKEEREQKILEEYLPPKLSSQELGQVVDSTIAELGARDVKEMGHVMQSVMARYKGRVDGKEVSTLVRSRLST